MQRDFCNVITFTNRPAPHTFLLSPGEIAIWIFNSSALAIPCTHRMTRQLLAKYLNVPIGQIKIAINKWNKPQITSPTGWDFSISRAGPFFGFALIREGIIGIDVETAERGSNTDLLQDDAFTESEQSLLRYPGTQTRAPFLRLWCRKEASVKAWGCGMQTDFQMFDVTGEKTLIVTPDSSLPPLRKPIPALRLHDLDAGQGVSAAVAFDCAVSSGSPVPIPFFYDPWSEFYSNILNSPLRV